MQPATVAPPHIARQPISAINREMADVANQSVQMEAPIEWAILVRSESVRLRDACSTQLLKIFTEPVACASGRDLPCERKSTEPIPRVFLMNFLQEGAPCLDNRVFGPAMPTLTTNQIRPRVLAASIWSPAMGAIYFPERKDGCNSLRFVTSFVFNG